MVNNICMTKEHCYYCKFYRPVFWYSSGVLHNRIQCLFNIPEYNHGEILYTYPDTANSIFNLFKHTPLDLDSGFEEERCNGCCNRCMWHSSEEHALCFKLTTNLQEVLSHQPIPVYEH